MRRPSTKRWVIVGFMLGFAVPILWGILGFLLFNLPESSFTRFYWHAVYFTCPAWMIPGFWGSMSMPFINGAMYATFAYLFMSTIRIIARNSET